jgi:hypothetical protein
MTDNQAHKGAARTALILYSVAFLAFVPVFLLFPARYAQLVEIQLTSASALADLRAVYGGFSLCLGVMFLKGLREPTWLEPSLFLAAASSAAVAIARTYSIAVSGVPNAVVLGFLALESVSAVWTWRVYRTTRVRRARPRFASMRETVVGACLEPTLQGSAQNPPFPDSCLAVATVYETSRCDPARAVVLPPSAVPPPTAAGDPDVKQATPTTRLPMWPASSRCRAPKTRGPQNWEHAHRQRGRCTRA